MKQNNRIAITGGIGSGKSTVAKIIAQKGYAVFSCDEIYDCLTKNQEFLGLLCANFGNVINGRGELNRVKLSEAVFGDENKLALLNSLTHPAIFKEMFARADGAGGTCFFEVPLLFEHGYQALFDGVIVVLRGVEERIHSVMQRDGLSRIAVEKRISSQYDYDSGDFAKYYVTHNNGDVKQLEKQISEILSKISGD